MKAKAFFAALFLVLPGIASSQQDFGLKYFETSLLRYEPSSPFKELVVRFDSGTLPSALELQGWTSGLGYGADGRGPTCSILASHPTGNGSVETTRLLMVDVTSPHIDCFDRDAVYNRQNIGFLRRMVAKTAIVAAVDGSLVSTVNDFTKLIFRVRKSNGEYIALGATADKPNRILTADLFFSKIVEGNQQGDNP